MAFLLLLPFFLVRFGLLSLLNQEAINRAAYFAPLLDNEKPAYWLYQISNVAIIVYMFFLKIKFVSIWLFYTGVVVYVIGIILLIVSVVSFATPAKSGINESGIYRLSRNPMYVAYFVFFFGCVLLTQSLVLLAVVLVFQITSHWIILSEERWCIRKFGNEYRQYMERVRRYI
ncbi:MAG: isoprenylcysteine carboxylmethyltransferase family protein [Angelakisella sp.]